MSMGSLKMIYDNDLFNKYFNTEFFKEHLIYLKLDVVYLDMVSNSHSSPKGKPTNWGGRDNKVPLGYPGWGGRYWSLMLEEQRQKCNWVSDALKSSNMHLGTGGYGTYNLQIANIHYDKTIQNYVIHNDIIINPYSYDVKLFSDDFPGLKEELSFYSDIVNGSKNLDFIYEWANPNYIDLK